MVNTRNASSGSPATDHAPSGLPPRFESLDFLRGCAILMVVLYHFFGFTYGGDILPWRGMWPDWRAAGWMSFKLLYPLRLGVHGVGLFFVLSGFCIHYSVRRGESLGAWMGTAHFYWKRFFRIVPQYWLAMGAALLLGGSSSFLNVVTHATLTHTLVADRSIIYGINPNFWSIAVEWQLYLVYPLALVMFRRCPPALALIVSATVTVVFRRWLPVTHPIKITGLPFYWWFEWCIGAYVAEVWLRTRAPAFHHRGFLVAVLGTLWVMTSLYRPLAYHAWWLRGLLGAVVLDAVVDSKGVLNRRPWTMVAQVGVVSYSMYLLHFPLLVYGVKPVLAALGLQASPAVMFGVALPVYGALLYGISWLAYEQGERRFIDWGRRLWPRVARVGRKGTLT